MKQAEDEYAIAPLYLSVSSVLQGKIRSVTPSTSPEGVQWIFPAFSYSHQLPILLFKRTLWM